MRCGRLGLRRVKMERRPAGGRGGEGGAGEDLSSASALASLEGEATTPPQLPRSCADELANAPETNLHSKREQIRPSWREAVPLSAAPPRPHPPSQAQTFSECRPVISRPSLHPRAGLLWLSAHSTLRRSPTFDCRVRCVLCAGGVQSNFSASLHCSFQPVLPSPSL